MSKWQEFQAAFNGSPDELAFAGFAVCCVVIVFCFACLMKETQ